MVECTARKPCPDCGNAMYPQRPYIPFDWPGADEYDHWWCDICITSFDFEELPP